MKAYTTEARYSIDREARMYREMFVYLAEKARAMVGCRERGSVTYSGKTHSLSVPLDCGPRDSRGNFEVLQSCSLSGECGE